MTVGGNLGRVVDLVREIVSGSKTGSAIDRYKIEPLWELGDQLLSMGKDEEGLWYVINSVLAKDGITTQPTLLKNAYRVRRYWPKKAEFDRVASVLGSYGKLKDVIQIFNPDAGVPPSEIEGFLAQAAGKTYVETLELAGRVKARYIRRESVAPVDADRTYDAIVSATSELARLIEAGDEKGLGELRATIDVTESRLTRLVLSSLQSPAVRKRYAKEVRAARLPSADKLDSMGLGSLGQAIRVLDELRSAEPQSLERLGKDVGLSFLGDLARVLKATESADERKRYLQNNDLLKRFLTDPAG